MMKATEDLKPANRSTTGTNLPHPRSAFRASLISFCMLAVTVAANAQESADAEPPTATASDSTTTSAPAAMRSASGWGGAKSTTAASKPSAATDSVLGTALPQIDFDLDLGLCDGG